MSETTTARYLFTSNHKELSASSPPVLTDEGSRENHRRQTHTNRMNICLGFLCLQLIQFLLTQDYTGNSIFFSFLFFYLWWILSYIEMKQPWVYMCSPSQCPLPPPSPPVPSRFSQCTRSERLSHASNLGW